MTEVSVRGIWIVGVLAGCSEYEIKGDSPEPAPVAPVIVVDPTSIEFGEVAFGDHPEQPFTISNQGTSPLHLGALSVGAPFSLASDPSAAELAPGDSIGGSVGFEPGATELFGQVQIPSDDPATPVATIDLHGEPGAGALEVSSVDFGYVEVGATSTLAVDVTNVAQWTVQVTTFTLDDPAFTADAFAPFPLDPGQTASVAVTFAPTDGVAYDGEITATTDDGGQGRGHVTGEGAFRPRADCDGLPAVPIVPLDAVTWVGSGSSDPAGRPITTSWALVSQPLGSFAALPTTAGPDVAGFVPDLPGVYVAELTVTNDLGLVDTCQAQVDAMDGTPWANCSASPNPAEAIHDVVTWSAAGSVDPLGGSLTYTWTLLSQPAGSVVPFPAYDPALPDVGGFVPDLVGTYTAQVVATNSVGLSSAPCVVDLDAIPSGDLWVEMYWSHKNDDMDLHLVRDTGSLRTSKDCYYANCKSGLSWGPTGPDGDPILDLDDIVGTGPENINVTTPEDLVYHVWVNDYPGHSYTGANDVTVNIYLTGVLAWTDTITISGDDKDVWFADVDWTTQTITP